MLAKRVETSIGVHIRNHARSDCQFESKQHNFCEIFRPGCKRNVNEFVRAH
jgi:hypothetical protein